MSYRYLFSVLIMMILCTGVSAEILSRETVLNAAGIEKDARLINIRLDRRKNVIKLDDTRLIEDDAPAKGVPEGYDELGNEWKEDLKKGIVIKKILLIDNPRAFSGRLLFNAVEVKGNTTPLHISLNGVEFVRLSSRYETPSAKQFIDKDWDRWYYVGLPSGALKCGENEILMWAESDTTSWLVLIALDQEYARGSINRPHHPNRSMKSSDGGRSWSDSKLGSTDSVNGEYAIRISLDSYVRVGEYISPIMDVIDDESQLKRKVSVQKICYMADIDCPEETAGIAFIRFGSSPLASDLNWSDWLPFEIGKSTTRHVDKRFVQWKAELSTDNPLKSPVIKGFTIFAEWEDMSPNSDRGLYVHIIHNGHVARFSYPFSYEDLLHPGLKKLRKKFKLDKIVKGAATEYDIMMRLLNWAYRIPVTSDRYSWNWNDVVKYEKGEKGMPRLQMDYKKRRRDAMCLYSNQALIGALLSFGYQARHVNIHSEGRSGHEVTEVWSNDYNKWIHLDATRDYYFFNPDTGIPMNILEVHDILAEQVPRVETQERPFWPEIGEDVVSRIRIGCREGDNPFPVVDDAMNIIGTMGYFRIIPRNDFLSHPVPVPVHTGTTMWGWDGFLNYFDEKFPKRYEYQLYTDRAVDFYEPLNQAEVFLTETDEPGILKVEVDTFTPGGFDTFIVRVDDGRWFEQKEPVWLWSLTGGIHTLDVRVRNVRGVLGHVSMFKVTYNP